MHDRALSTRRPRAVTWSAPGLLLLCVVLAAGLLLGACASGSSGSGSPATVLGEAVSTTLKTENMSPSELGDAIAATWAEAMRKLVALLESKPEPDAVRGQIEQLKEAYVNKLVDFGQQSEALDRGDKAQVSFRTSAGLDAAGGETWYADYRSLYENYSAGDQEFATLLASFNILNQYADFDLLKQQSPEEAARLGIH